MKVRTERMKKEMALMMGIVMIAMVFGAMQTGSAYPHYSESNAWNIQITSDGLTGTYYPGEQDVSFTITIRNTAGGGETDTDQIDGCNVYIQTGTIRDENGNTVTSPISNWDNDRDEWGGNIANGFSNTFGTFSFDIAPDAVPGVYNLTIDMSFTDHGGTPSGTQHFTGYVLFTIANNIQVSDAYPNLYAGQTFTPLNIDVDDTWEGVHNLYLNLSNIPTGITFDNTVGFIPGDVERDTIGFRVDVARDMDPGIYTIDYQVQYYNNDDVWCTETGTLDIVVDFTPVIEAQLTGTNITVTQGDASIPALGVTFTNTGNVPLRDIDIYLDYDGYFFYAATDYYEGEGDSGDQNPVQVTNVHIDSLDVGATAQGQWFVALNPYVQAGDHRILFDWTATYFDDGSTGNPTTYVDTTMEWWDDDWDPSTPMVPEIRFNGGPWHSPWIAGPYVMITVVDNHPDFSASKIENYDTGNDYFDLADDELVNVEVYSQIHNFELSRFTELRATLQVGGDTPFWNPQDHSLTTVENDLTDSDDTVNAGGNADMYWYVDINPDTHPGIYTVNITLTGRNADTTEYITTTIQAVVEVRGFGPEIVVSSVVTDDIEPGHPFYLNLTIENKGDDTARDVFVFVPGVGTNQWRSDWEIIDGFVSAISSYNKSYAGWWGLNGEERNVTSNGITLQQLNISDAKEIVDLGLYIEGVFDNPSAQIWVMKATNLAPGQTVTVSFKMITNSNMKEGRPYVVNVGIGYVDTYGVNHVDNQGITVKTKNVGTAYHSTPTTQNAGKLTDQQLIILGIILLVILLIIVGIALAGRGGGGKKKKEPVVEAPPVEEPTTEEPAPEEMPLEEPGFTLEEKEEGESSF